MILFEGGDNSLVCLIALFSFEFVTCHINPKHNCCIFLRKYSSEGVVTSNNSQALQEILIQYCVFQSHHVHDAEGVASSFDTIQQVGLIDITKIYLLCMLLFKLPLFLPCLFDFYPNYLI